MNIAIDFIGYNELFYCKNYTPCHCDRTLLLEISKNQISSKKSGFYIYGFSY